MGCFEEEQDRIAAMALQQSEIPNLSRQSLKEIAGFLRNPKELLTGIKKSPNLSTALSYCNSTTGDVHQFSSQ